MSSINIEKLWAKLNELGEEQVSKNLALGIYGERKERLVEEWLRQERKKFEQKGETKVQLLAQKARDHPIIAVTILVGTSIIFISSVIGSINYLRGL